MARRVSPYQQGARTNDRRMFYSPSPVYISNDRDRTLSEDRILAARADMAESQAQSMHRSPISTFAADGDGNFSFYNGDQDSQLRAGFDGIVAQADRSARERARRGQATLSWMYGDAMRNGGLVRREAIPALRQELGADFDGAVILPNGGLMIGKVASGKFVPTGAVRPRDVLRAAVSTGDWDTADALANSKAFNGRYTPAQIEQMTGWSQTASSRGRASKEAAALEKEKLGFLLGVAKDVMKSDDPVTEFKKRLMQDDRYRASLMQSTRPIYEEDGKTQKVDGNGNPMFEEATPDEMRQRLDRDASLVFGGDGRQDTSRESEKMALVNALFDRLYPQAQQSPEAAAMEQRNLERQNIIDAAGGKQTGFYYRRGEGDNAEMVATSGYVVDGKAYDRFGNPMNVQPLDYQGNPIVGATAQQGVAQPTQPANPLSQPVSAINGANSTQPQGGVTQYTPEQIAALKAEKARRNAEKAAANEEYERQRRLKNGQTYTGAKNDVTLTPNSPEWHIDKIINDGSLSEKSKAERIAYWRRRQEENRQRSAAELGVASNDDLAMLEAEINGPTTMIAAN